MGEGRPQPESGQGFKGQKQPNVKLMYLVEVIKTEDTEKWVSGPSPTGPPEASMAKIVRTDKDKNNYKQFVNVPETIRNNLAEKEIPAHGMYITLKAKIEFEGDQTGAAELSGYTVKFSVTSNSAKKEKVTFKINDQKKQEAKTNIEGWTPEVQFFPSFGPGVEFKIMANLKEVKDNTLELGTYVVWRKIWFQASYMSGKRDDVDGYCDLEAVQKHYDPVFIQLEMAEKKEMDFHIECINEGQHSAGFFKIYFSKQNEKFEPLITHLLFVDKMSKNADIKLTMELNDNGEGKTETTALLCGAEDGRWLFKDASYTDESRNKISIDNNWLDEIKLSRADSPYGVKTTIDVKKANKKGSVTLTAYSVDVQNYNAGMAHDHDIYIALGQWKNDYPDETQCKIKVLGTIIHEFGHQLGMVPPKGRKKGKNGDVGKFIQDGGPHCTDKNCVMYKEQNINKDRPLDFCVTCKKSLLTMSFKKLASVEKGKK